MLGQAKSEIPSSLIELLRSSNLLAFQHELNKFDLTLEGFKHILLPPSQQVHNLLLNYI